MVSTSLHPSLSFAEFPSLPPEPAAGWQRPPPTLPDSGRQQRLRAEGPTPPSITRQNGRLRSGRAPSLSPPCPFPPGPGWLQQEAQCFSPGAETAAATGQPGSNVQFIEHFPPLSLTGTLRPPCEVSGVGGDLSSDSQIEEREAQEDEVTALGPPSWGRPGHSPSLRGSRGGGPQLERLWPKPQLARLGKPVLKQACAEVHGCVHSGWEHGTCMHRGVCTGVGNLGEACERMRRSPASAMPTLKSYGVGLIHLSIHSSNIF